MLGNIELTDIPEEGPLPRYWEYERTMLQRLYMKYVLRGSDMEGEQLNQLSISI